MGISYQKKRQTPKGEAGGSIPFWRAKNPGNRSISGIFIDDAKYNTHKKAPDVELQEVLSRIMRKLVCRLWLDEVSRQ